MNEEIISSWILKCTHTYTKSCIQRLRKHFRPVPYAYPLLIHTYWNKKIWSRKWHNHNTTIKIWNYRRLFRDLHHHFTGLDRFMLDVLTASLGWERRHWKTIMLRRQTWWSDVWWTHPGRWHGTSIVANSCHWSDADNWETELCFGRVRQFKDMETSAVWLMHHPDTNTCTCEGRDALSECIYKKKKEAKTITTFPLGQSEWERERENKPRNKGKRDRSIISMLFHTNLSLTSLLPLCW